MDEPNNDFTQFAQKYSEDETSKDQGGHLGRFILEELQEKEFKRVIETLNVGEISQPFRTRFGWHILKLNNKEEERKLSIDKDWEDIENLALNHKRQIELNKWLEELKKETFVDIKK